MEEFEKVLHEFLDYYKSYFKGNKDLVVIEQCEIFIKNYFDDLYKKICDENDVTILSLSEMDTKIVRTRFGVYDNGICQSYETVRERINYKYPSSTIDKFRREVFADLNKKVLAYSKLLEQSDDQVIEILEVYLGEDIINLLKNEGIHTVYDLLCLTSNDILFVKGMNLMMSLKVINVLHLLGYKLANEKDDVNVDRNKDYLFDPERLDIVRKLLEAKYKLNQNKKDVAEMNDQIALMLCNKRLKEKESKELELDIERLEFELQKKERPFKK